MQRIMLQVFWSSFWYNQWICEPTELMIPILLKLQGNLLQQATQSSKEYNSTNICLH